MLNKKIMSRRRILLGGAAFGLAGCATSNELGVSVASKYVMQPPDVVSMNIKDSNEKFPLRRVFCLGRNYRAHAIESGDNPDETPPFFFIKPRDAVVDSRKGFPYPQMATALRHEVELVVALKEGGAEISEANALDHIYGYGVGLDMTRQDLQETAQEMSRPWAISKSFDHSAPCGPLYPVEKFGHAEKGRIWLSVNDDMRQDSDLSLQRWSVAEGIAILSRFYRLSAGDIILTGTPAGIGLVKKGDVIKAGIEGLDGIEVVVT